MKWPVLPLLVAGVLVGCEGRSNACTGSDPAAIVAALPVEANFRSMLTRTANRTQTIAMARVSDPHADRNLREAVDKAVKRHLNEWSTNLVSSWATLDAANRANSCAAINERNQVAFEAYADPVADVARSRNEPVLKRAAVEVMDEVWSAATAAR